MMCIYLTLIMHWVSCIWVMIGGGNQPDGWLWLRFSITSREEFYQALSKEHFHSYIDALYFIATTMTTVGYGDYTAGEPASQKMFMMFMEFFGIAVFTMIQQKILNLQSEVDQNARDKEIAEEIEGMCFDIDRTLAKKHLEQIIYDMTIESTKGSLQYSTEDYFFNSNFYQELTPRLQT